MHTSTLTDIARKLAYVGTLQARIAELMEATDWSVGEISRITGVSSSAVSQWKDGPTKTIKIGPATKLAVASGYSAVWIATGEGPKKPTSNVIALHAEDDLPDDFIQVAEYKVKFSGGNGQTVVSYDLQEESEPATYRLSWMQRMRLSPDKLKRFKVKGDSMEPLLFDGDSVLVNLAENDFSQLSDGKVYAIRYGNELRVKRLFRRLDGGLVLHSDNPAYKDEDLTPALVAEHITIIGRVRDKSGSGGL